MLVSGILSNLTGMFDATNQQVADISGQIALTPQAWNGSIFTMIQNLSNSVIVPIAGAILAFVMTLELIQLITDKNNLHELDTWMFFKWAFKSAAGVLIVTNTWNIVMGIFDAAGSVVRSASGLIAGSTNIDINSILTNLETRLNAMDVGPLFGLWFQSLFAGICTWAVVICIMIVIYGRMIEVYQFFNEQLKDRNTEEVEAESISYAVCQYFGIETSDNSFGYIAEWSKGRELKELRSSLEIISETASSLISDIEKHFHQLCKEKGIDLTPAMEQSIDSQNKPSQRETNILAFDIDQLLLDYYTFAHLRDYPDREEARKEIVQGLLDGSAKYSLEEIQSIADDTDSQYSSQAKALHQRLTDYLNRMHPGWEEKETTAEPVAAMLPDNPEQAKEEPMPDPTITTAFMENYGYKDSGMLPLSHDRAKELMAHDVTLYMLYEDGTESMVLDEWDIAHHDGLFGISREDWEAIKEQVPARDVEKRFLDFPGDAFAIYQLRPDAPAELFGARFSNLSKPPEEANYQAVYVRHLNPGDDVQTNLYNIVDIFTRDMPRDFTGHENDIGDIIALKRSGEVSYHYCDYIGFREIPPFQRAENHLKAAEMSMEDDYGMIDGIINNGKAPSVAEQERKDKKPSLLAQLHQPVQERTTRTAPKKSAERDI